MQPASSPAIEHSGEKGFIGELLVVIVLFVVVTGGAFFYFNRTFFTSNESTTTNQTEIKVPAGAVRVSACIPTEGEHWVELQNVTNGPYYVVHEGRVVSMEYMVIPDDIPGKEFAHLPPDQVVPYIAERGSLDAVIRELHMNFDLRGIPFDHFDFHWTPPHAGLPIPHYDIHFYLVSEAERAEICPEATVEENFAPELLQRLQELNIPLPGGDAPPPTEAE